MAIEIRELIIKANVVEQINNNEQKNSVLSKNEIEKLKKEIINTCVEQVLDEIKKEKDR